MLTSYIAKYAYGYWKPLIDGITLSSMQCRHCKTIGYALPHSLEYLQDEKKKNLKSGNTETGEVALTIVLNVKVREHKEAQLDIIGFIVHIKVDDKNVSMNHGWGSNSHQTIKATPWQYADEKAVAVKIM